MAIIYLKEYPNISPVECPGCYREYCLACRELFDFIKSPTKKSGNFQPTDLSAKIFAIANDGFPLIQKLPFEDIRRETGDIATTLHFPGRPTFSESYPISFPVNADGKLDTEKVFGEYCALHNPKCIDYRGK